MPTKKKTTNTSKLRSATKPRKTKTTEEHAAEGTEHDASIRSQSASVTPNEAPNAEAIESARTTEDPTTSTAKRPDDGLVTFAFRLTPAERSAIHDAAGRGKASQFVKTTALAAARGDLDAIKELIERG